MKNVKKIDAKKLTDNIGEIKPPFRVWGDLNISIDWRPRSPMKIMKAWIRKLVSDEN